MGVVTGAILRWRMLPSCSIWLATRLTVAVGLSFLAGWAVVTAGAVVVLGQPEYGPMGWAVLALAALGLGLAALRPPAPFRWPNLFTLVSLIALCALDTLAAAAALYMLVPAEIGLPFAALLPAFLLAYGAGLISGAPGGIGAFELAFLALLPLHPEAPLLGAVIAWRLVYFVLPALMGAALAIAGPRRAPPAPMVQRYDRLEAWSLGHALQGPAEMGLMAQGEHHFLANSAQGSVLGQMAAARGHVLVGLLDPVLRGQMAFAKAGGHARQARAKAALTLVAGSARAAGFWPALYKVSAPVAAAARSAGWRSWCIAREAVLAPQQFDLASPARAGLRRKLRRATAAGVVSGYVGADDLPMAQMAALAHAWAQRQGGERGFSMGRFAPDYIAGQRVYLAHVQGVLVGFVSFHTLGAQEWTLDIMRHGPQVPDGTMQALVCAAILDAKAMGVARLSLAAAPQLAFSQDAVARPMLAAARKLGIDTGQGLRQFKEAFAPIWTPRYLCAPHWAGLLLAALSIWRAVATQPARGTGPAAVEKTDGAGHNRFALPAHIWQGRQ